MIVKRILPLEDEEMQKSKVCDEMIQFETPEIYPPNGSVVTDFEDTLDKYLDTLSTKITQKSEQILSSFEETDIK